MNLPLVVYIAFTLAVLAAAVKRPLWLLFIWPITMLDLPSLRGLPGGVPLYLHATATAALCLGILVDGRWRESARALPWYAAFLTVGLLFGALVPALRYGALPQNLYLFIQQGIAWAGLPIGVWVVGSKETTRACAWGFLAALFGLAVLAVMQRGNPALGEMIQSFYHRDVRPMAMSAYQGYSEEYVAKVMLYRAFAPFQSATTLSGIAVVSGLAAALLWRHENPRWGWLSLAFATVVVAMTVSRHAVVALVLGGIVLLLVGPAATRLRTLFALAGGLLMLFQFESLAGVWEKRMRNLQYGILADENVSARVIDGPLQFLEYISNDPIALFLGSGIEPHKLNQRGIHIDYTVLEGFVSNGFLLYWYGFGVIGFSVFLSFWIWVLARCLVKDPKDRPYALSATLVVMAIVAADNYPYVDEVAVTLVYFVAGAVAFWGDRKPASERDEDAPLGDGRSGLAAERARVRGLRGTSP